MTVRRDKPNAPPPYYDQRWLYWFWQYVNHNLGTSTFGTFASLPWLAAAGDALGTSTTGTLTLALSTTGVTAGTYGGTAGIPRFDISARGRVNSATNVAVEVQAPLLLTKGAGTLQFSHDTSGVTAGTYGTGGTMVSQITVDAKGHVTAVSNVGITFPAAGGGTSTATWTGVITGTGTIPGGAIALNLPANPNFTGTGTAAGWLWTGTGTGAMIQVGTGTGGFSRWGTMSSSLSLTGTGSAGLYSATSVQAIMGSAAGSFGRVLVGMQSIVGSTRTTQGTFTYAVATAPLNAIKGTGNGIRMALWGTWNVKPDTMFWVIGTGTVTFSPPAPGIGSTRWSTELNLFSLTDTTQTYLAYYIGAGGTTANQDIQSGTLALATGSAFRIHFAGTQSTAAGTSVCHGGVIDFRNGP